MNNRPKLLGILLTFVFVICGCQGVFKTGIDTDSTHCPVHKVSERDPVDEWIVLGAFDNPEVDETLPDGSKHLGFYKDYLESIGTEQQAVLKPDTSIVFEDTDGTEQKANAEVAKAQKGIVNLQEVFGSLDNKVAYAFCYILSDKEQEAGFLFGSDDGAKVWINGELVHKIYTGRALIPGQDKFSAKLQKGLNSVLVKVTQWTREWAFAMEVISAEGYAKAQAEEQAKKDFAQFLNCRVVPQYGNYWDYTFGPGKLPPMGWDRPYLVEKVMGKFDLDIKWFDGQLNEVKEAAKPGRYAFTAEATTPKGIHIRRAGTMYCTPSDWLAWSERPKAYLEYLPFSDVSRQAWHEHKEAIALNVGRMVLLSLLAQEEGAVLMSYLDEMEAAGCKPSLTDTPVIRDHEYHLALKRKLLGIENKYPQLRMPRKKTSEPATVLHEGTPAEAGVKADTADKIRAVCQEWFEHSKEPFVVLIARRGVVIIHEAFGEDRRGRITTETATPMASITKLFTGVMFAQFVDQGLIGIDDPVGKFLPDYPLTGDKVITLRQCFTHTTGLYGHEEFSGMHNPWLENVISNGLEHLQPGKVHNYNGMGYDLAGRIMEIVSGKSIFRLMRENFFEPLELKNTVLEEDLGFSCNGTARDLAMIGQLLLNKGSYGDLEFFSHETFEKITPKPLKDFYPDVDVDWGIGITWMRQTHPQAGKNDVPKDKTVLSKNIIGHGSATSAVLRVDLDNELVITQTRRIAGKSYGKYLLKLLQTIEQGLIE